MGEKQADYIRLGRRLRFGEFEADFGQYELYRRRQNGVPPNGADISRVPLQRKPFQILEMLLRRPGCLVTRQELAHELWPELRVSFEKSLNTAVNALRLALGDSPRDGRFVQTRPGLGYRFVAPVEEVASSRDTSATPISFSAQQDCLTGRYFLNKITSGDVHKAIAYFRAALQDDPGCALAYAGLSEAHTLLALRGAARAGEVCQQARALAAMALQMSAGLAEAHVALAQVKMTFDWDWAGAQADCLRARELAPRMGDVHRCYAALLSALAHHEDAEGSARCACVLEPLSLAAGTALAWSFYLAHNFASAEQQCWKMLTLEPRFTSAQMILGMVYEQQSAYAEALIELENARRSCDGEAAPMAALGHAFGKAGDRQKAIDVLEQIGKSSWYSLAIVHCGLAEKSRAIEALERGIRERDPLLLWVKVDPRLEPIREHAAFERLLEKVGLGAMRAGARG
jgi:DNA-binding winged helix-turn-helix (wHTH) protein